MITLLHYPEGIVYLQKDLRLEFSSSMTKQHENDLLYIEFTIDFNTGTFNGRQLYKEGTTGKMSLYNIIFDKVKEVDFTPRPTVDTFIPLPTFFITLREVRETFNEGSNFQYTYTTEYFEAIQTQQFSVLPTLSNALIPVTQDPYHIGALLPKTKYNYIAGGQFFLSYYFRNFGNEQPLDLKITYHFNDQTSEEESEILGVPNYNYSLNYLNIGVRFNDKINTATIDGKSITRAEIQLGTFALVTCYFEPTPRYESYALGYLHTDGSLQVVNTKGQAELSFKAKEHVYSTLLNQFGADLESTTQTLQLNTGILSKEEFFFFAQILESQYLFLLWENEWRKITRAKAQYKYLPNSAINSIDLDLTIEKKHF